MITLRVINVCKAVTIDDTLMLVLLSYVPGG